MHSYKIAQNHIKETWKINLPNKFLEACSSVTELMSTMEVKLKLQSGINASFSWKEVYVENINL